MTCSTCRWFDLTTYFADLSDPPAEQMGACVWPAEQLPFSLRYGNRERTSVTPLDGAGCAQYQPKT